MATTRNKLTRLNFDLDTAQMQQQAQWWMTSPHYNPAYPCNQINVQHIPAMLLSKNSVDIESNLFGISNYVHPTPPVTPRFTRLENVEMIAPRPVYIPILPPIVPNQRPSL